jgi:cytochrome P450
MAAPNPSASSVLARFNPFDLDQRRDPYSFFADARQEGALLRHPLIPLYMAFRYDDVEQILKDDSRFSSDLEQGAIARMTPEQLAKFEQRRRDDLPPMMIFTDGAQHQRLRGLVNQAFTPRMVAQLRPRMVEIAEELLEAALAEGEVDVIGAYAHPLPLIVIAEMIGVPISDRDRFKAWSDALVSMAGSSGFLEPPPDEVVDAQIAIIDEMREYFRALADDRRKSPRDDLLSGLVAAEVEGSKLSLDEMLQMLVLLLVAGNETTRTLIGNAIQTLIDHPDAQAEVRADPGLVPGTIEEVLRYASPFHLMARRANAPLEYAGQKLDESDMILCWIGSANRDPRAFDHPDRFDVHRSPNRHLAFSIGRHFCLGANLARAEGQVALEVLLRRAKSFARVDDEPLPLHASFAFNAFTEMPLALEAA